MEDSSPGADAAGTDWRRGPLLRLGGVAVLLFAGLLVYSQTLAFAWDEGFHLLAAQLIKAGKKPYLDFCFPQTPLNAYLNAAWMRLFGEGWRAVHALAAFWVAAAAFLMADFIRTRLPLPGWRLPAAVGAAVAVAMNSQVVLFGTIGEAYGICLFLTVAAFRMAIWSVRRKGAMLAAAAGVMAGAAAASSLLSAPVAPVLILWIPICNRAGRRWDKLAGFLGGAALPFLPVVSLYRQGPRQVLFNIIQYQLYYRRVKWDGATGQDISTLTSWIDSAQGLSLGLLAVVGVWFLVRRSGWERERKAEFYLAGCLALALGLELATARPTFERYFLLLVPFVAVLAIVGLFYAGSRLDFGDRPWRPALFLILLTALGLGKAIFEDRDSYSWKDCEKIARQVDQVTPPGGSLWADELFYFLTRRPPPDGMQFSYAHDLELPRDQAALFHVLPVATIHQRVRDGVYGTVAACYESDQVDKVNLPQLFRHKAEIKDCTVY